MTTPQGTIFVTALGLGLPAVSIASYFLQWNWVIHSSLAAKTLWTLGYIYVLRSTVIPYFTSPLRDLPTPRGPSIALGHAIQCMTSKPPGGNMLKWLDEIPNDGLIVFQGWFHSFPNLIVTTPEAIMDVLNTHAADWEKHADGRAFLTRIIGNGLVVSEGTEHREQRKNATPAFSGRVIKDLVPLFWSKGLSLAEAVKREAAASDGTIDIIPLAGRATLDIIGCAGIGKDFRSLEDADHEIVQHYEAITDPKKGNGLMMLFLLTQTLPLWLTPRLPIKANRKMDHATSNLRRLTKQMLAEKKTELKDGGGEQKDIVATLMRGGHFTDDELTDQLLTFLAAG